MSWLHGVNHLNTWTQLSRICCKVQERGYNVNDQLDFVLIVIKRDYNANDRLKFILSFIRRDNGLNDRVKLAKNGRKENRK